MSVPPLGVTAPTLTPAGCRPHHKPSRRFRPIDAGLAHLEAGLPL